ncbi:ligand-effect modulator 3 family [Geopyxis carbonaria]|nr:ligand-effect modulator 3 family [Geopyxis carbonaria]
MASSIDEREGEDQQQKKGKSRKPGNTAFRQQRLKAWQPILTPKTVLPLFFIIGVIFAPIGGLLLYASAQVQELVVDYTSCDSASTKLELIPSKYYRSSFATVVAPKSAPKWKFEKNQTSIMDTAPDYQENVCTIEFEIPNDLKPPLLMYYRLSNFYQNHRRYVQSLDEDQLKGKRRTKSQLDSAGDCDPLTGEGSPAKPYYPCGLIANSIFNDTFQSPINLNVKNSDESQKEYKMTNKGIAWDSDKERFGKTSYSPDEVIPPPNWQERYPDGYNETTMPRLRENEEFQVWMRTAGLPTFSKLALRNDNDKMTQGRYRVKIYSRFPVKAYSGTKSIVISTRTVMGGKNPFLGIAYVVVGGLCVLLGALFTARHLIKPRKLGDHTYLSWNNDESSGQASGREVQH